VDACLARVELSAVRARALSSALPRPAHLRDGAVERAEGLLSPAFLLAHGLCAVSAGACDPRMIVIPLTLKAANAFTLAVHRHHGAFPPGLDYFRIGAVTDEGELVGVAIGARPPNRNSDDGFTVEVVRCATNGHKNACSFLYGHCARIARTMGFRRIITYTLDDESGASLRAAGWTMERRGIQSYWQSHQSAGRTVQAREHYAKRKTRWAMDFTLNEQNSSSVDGRALADAPVE